MAEPKKYSAQEAAIAVLAKTQELLTKSALMKASNPDEKQDAKLGEDVEHLCEEHMMANKDAERKEGHKILKSEIEKCMKCEAIRMKKSEFAELYEDLEKLSKAENPAKPSNSLDPKIKEQPIERDNKGFETQPGHSSTSGNDQRQASTPAPGANLVEQREGNNPMSGTVPGHYKLAAFCGHMHSKRKMKKGIALS